MNPDSSRTNISSFTHKNNKILIKQQQKTTKHQINPLKTSKKTKNQYTDRPFFNAMKQGAQWMTTTLPST